MKTIQWPLALMAAAAFALAGCKKSQEQPPDTYQIGGGTVDVPKLRQAFSTSTNPAVRRLLFEVDQQVRIRDYVKGLMALDELSNQPDLTEPQKKIVVDVIEQVKKLASNAPAPAQ
jgi:hypothetical protein